MNLRLLPVLAAGCGIAAAQNPLTDQVMARYRAIRQNLVETAEVMPEGSYDYRLTPAQRTFGEWIGHTAMGNYSYCAVIKGEKTPDTKHLHDMKSKGELSKALIASFEYCDAALKGMTDQKALTSLTVDGKTMFPATGMVNLVASDNEHYGNLVGYLRTKGITPPSTARAAKKK